jgi:hypothetical protein
MTSSPIETFDNDPHVEATLANMAADGRPVETAQIIDFWSFSQKFRYYLPGQESLPEHLKQYIEFERMNEGKKAEFQRRTNRDVRIQNVTKDIKMNMDAAKDRHTLIEISVTDWFMFRKNYKGEVQEIAFDQKQLKAFLTEFDPAIVQGLEQEIRDENPWMKQEQTVEEIDAEIENLQEQRKEAEKREAAK